MPTLTIQLPGLPSVEHIVREDAITLGRMKGNSIALNDSSVSLSHAKITRVGNDFFLKDLNSTNGTMLNGQSVTEARLRDGDQLKFGEVIAYFRVEPLTPPAAIPAATGPEIVPASVPKPVAQSVSPPLAISPAGPGPVAVIRPPVPPPRRRSLLWPVLILGGFLGLAATGILMWKFYVPAPTAAVPPAATVTTPNNLPASNAAVRAAVNGTAAGPVPDQNLDVLVRELKSPDAAVRQHAAAALYNLGAAAAPVLSALPESLTDSDPDVRMWTALALVHNNIFDPATIPILIQTLRQVNPTLRQVACLSLAMIPYTGADKEPVIAALTETATKDANAEVANDALTALKIIAPDRVIGK